MINKNLRDSVSVRFKKFMLESNYKSQDELLNELNKVGKEINHSISFSGLNKIMRGASSPQLETLYCFNRLGLSIDFLVSGQTPLADKDFDEFKTEFRKIVKTIREKEPDATIDAMIDDYRKVSVDQRDAVLQILKLLTGVVKSD